MVHETFESGVYEKRTAETIAVDIVEADLWNDDVGEIVIEDTYVERLTPIVEDIESGDAEIQIVTIKRNTPRYW